DKVLTCALAKSPADRYQTAEQLREALQYGLTGTSQISSTSDWQILAALTPPPAGAQSPNAIGRTGAMSTLSNPPPLASGQTTVILKRQHLARATAVFGALVVGVASLAYVAMVNTSAPTTPVGPPAPAASPSTRRLPVPPPAAATTSPPAPTVAASTV